MTAWSKYSKVKCGCGHYPSAHFNREGGCTKCACTWYYPNDNYVRKKNGQKMDTKSNKKDGG